MTKKHYRVFRGRLKGAQAILALLVCVLCASCATEQKLPIAQLPPPPKHEIILIEPLDELDIRFRFWPDLNEIQTVRPDGRISLPIIDEVEVAGKTPEEVDQILTERYSAKIKDPDITVIARSLQNQHVYVSGQVLNPGVVYLLTSLRAEARTPGTASLSIQNLTVMQAIFAAGGFNRKTAEPRNVIVIRMQDGKYYATSIDCRQKWENPETEPFLLAPNDLVYVPENRITNVNKWVEQYIEEVIPNTPIFYSHPLGRGMIGYSSGD